LVPIGTWLYHSPRLRINNINIDMGLVCEALIYYDKVCISIDSKDQFNAIVFWFQKQNAFDKLLKLLYDQSINFAYNSFITVPIKKDNSYIFANIQDEEARDNNVFNQRILYNSDLNNITKTKERTKLFKAIVNNVVELKADDMGNSVNNAESDFNDPEKSDIIIQSFIDDLYAEFGYEKPVSVQSSLKKIGTNTSITWNVDFDDLNNKTENKLNINNGAPLTGILHCNRFIKTSSIVKSDLYLTSAMNSLVNNKLAEIKSKNTKISSVVKELNIEVEFPKISDLINAGVLTFNNILIIRKEAKKFRNWLQQEGERDRNAIIAYHHEVAEKTKLIKYGGGFLSATGGALLAGTIATTTLGPLASAPAAAVGAGVGQVVDKFISSFNEDWKPVVFGNWVTKYVKPVEWAE